MNTGIVILIIVLIIIILGVIGFLIYWFGFRKKTPTDDGTGGNTGPTGANITFTAIPSSNDPLTWNFVSRKGLTDWSWNFGDTGPNSTATAPNPTHTYSLSGNYNVSLSATNSSGNTGQSIQTINVSESGYTGGANFTSNAVSYLLDPTSNNSYNTGETLQFSKLQGTTTDAIDNIASGIWTANIPGQYLIYADATNSGGGGSISIISNGSIVGRQFLNGSGTKTLFTMGYSVLDNSSTVSVITNDNINVGIDKGTSTIVSSHFIIQQINPNTIVNYLVNSSGGNIASNGTIPFSVPQNGTDMIGNMSSNWLWSPKKSGTFLVFSNVTNIGGGGNIAIVKNNNTSSKTVGFGAKTGSGENTISTMGLVTLNTSDNISVITQSGVNITTPDPNTNATCNFLIQQVDPTKIVSYILDKSQTLGEDVTIPFSEQQGGATGDSLGSFDKNNLWTCANSGNYLIFTDATNDGGGGEIGLNQYTSPSEVNPLGYGYSSNSGSQTIRTMGYAQMNVGDSIQVFTITGISITNPNPVLNATCHLIIYKISDIQN